MLKTISPSQMDAMSCRFAWHLAYPMGYKPRRVSSALSLGIGVHEALDYYYSEKGHPRERFKVWSDEKIKSINPQYDDDIQKMHDIQDLGTAMLNGYYDLYDGKDDFDIIATEQTLSRPIPIPSTGARSHCKLVARLDGLVRDHETGKLWSLEHKTFRSFSLSQLELNQQFTAQIWLGQGLAKSMGIDEPVVGVIYNGLRKQKPGPRVKLKLFERHKLYRTQRHIDTMLHRAYWQYREMNKKNLPIYPQPNPIRCSGCSYKEVCIEYQRGGDWQYLLKENFDRRKRDR